MRVLGIPKLDEFKRNHTDSRGPVDSWLAEAKEAVWNGPQDIKDRYNHASFLADNFVVFNIKGNRYRLIVKVAYNTKIVKIEKVLTHEEYTRLYS